MSLPTTWDAFRAWLITHGVTNPDDVTGIVIRAALPAERDQGLRVVLDVAAVARDHDGELIVGAGDDVLLAHTVVPLVTLPGEETR